MTYVLCGTQGDIIQNGHTSLFHTLKVESDHGELRFKKDKLLLYYLMTTIWFVTQSKQKLKINIS